MTQFAQEFPPAKTDHGKSRKKKDGSYTVRVRHDAQVNVTTTYFDHVDVDVMTVKQLEGYLLTLGCLYNVSGYYNPLRPKVTYNFVDLKKATLKKGELCTCYDCTIT
jgi:hypothetical protein